MLLKDAGWMMPKSPKSRDGEIWTGRDEEIDRCRGAERERERERERDAPRESG
jgi:hypothetical protein